MESVMRDSPGSLMARWAAMPNTNAASSAASSMGSSLTEGMAASFTGAAGVEASKTHQRMLLEAYRGVADGGASATWLGNEGVEGVQGNEGGEGGGGVSCMVTVDTIPTPSGGGAPVKTMIVTAVESEEEKAKVVSRTIDNAPPAKKQKTEGESMVDQVEPVNNLNAVDTMSQDVLEPSQRGNI